MFPSYDYNNGLSYYYPQMVSQLQMFQQQQYVTHNSLSFQQQSFNNFPLNYSGFTSLTSIPTCLYQPQIFVQSLPQQNSYYSQPVQYYYQTQSQVTKPIQPIIPPAQHSGML